MHIIIIILQIVVGIFFFMIGVKILSGTMSQEFERLGYPKIFNQITGIFEFVGGLALLIGIFFVPSALFGSILLGCTMFVAALSLIFNKDFPFTKALPALILFLLNVVVFWYYI